MNNLVNITIYEANFNQHLTVINYNRKVLDSSLIINISQTPVEVFEYLIKDIIYEYDPNGFEEGRYFTMFVESIEENNGEPYKLSYCFKMMWYDDIEQQSRKVIRL